MTMWDLGGVWGNEGMSTSMASFHAIVHEIHVLVVDHDTESLMNTAKMLEMCSYRVTFVELASAAISMISSGKAKFDIVMANVNSPDLHGFKLLQLAVNMDLPVILMSADDNAFMAMKALENGAFLFIKKPATLEILRCLWQYVLKEKTRMVREKERLIPENNIAAAAGNNYNVRGVEIYNGEDYNNYMNHGAGNNSSHMMMMNNKLGKVLAKKKLMGQKSAGGWHDDGGVYGSENNHMLGINKVRRKVCTEWTQDLHAKFMEAVRQLGEGRCFPKEILDLMNTPGLTRMQVASHLQKCRNDNWRSPDERKSQQISSSPQAAATDINMSNYKPRRFGSMPGQLVKQQSETETPDKADHENGKVAAAYEHPHGKAARGSSRRRHPSDDFFSFTDMDCLIQNFSGMPQGSAINPPQASGSGPYQVYPHQQNSVVPSMDARSQWSSEGTTNFESDGSETKDINDDNN
ncbi:two-component response regulator ORR26-like [Henckelia pumila]|uniref:two-component response regulator ORR26-like n=1 Tax=Henckelia pumila TaxID=405737 RepID=UPI003C6E1DBD